MGRHPPARQRKEPRGWRCRNPRRSWSGLGGFHRRCTTVSGSVPGSWIDGMAREDVLSFTFQMRSRSPDPAYAGSPSAFALSSRNTGKVQALSDRITLRVTPYFRAISLRTLPCDPSGPRLRTPVKLRSHLHHRLEQVIPIRRGGVPARAEAHHAPHSLRFNSHRRQNMRRTLLA